MKRRKSIPAGPVLARGVEVTLVDWRWPVAGAGKLRMRARISAGMPQEIRGLVEQAKRETGYSMSEIVRRSVVMTLGSSKSKNTARGA